MLLSLPAYIRRVAFILKMASLTPRQIMQVLDIFVEILEDQKNFLDEGLWNTEDKDSNKIPQMALSKEGLSKLKSRLSGELDSVYRSGTAGMAVPFLTYFIVQFLVIVYTVRERLDLMGMEDIDKKYPRLHRLDVIKVYDATNKFKTYMQAKSYLMKLLQEYRTAFEKISEKELSEKDLEMIKKD